MRKSTTEVAVCELWSKNEQGLQLQKRENSEHSRCRERRAAQQREDGAGPERSVGSSGWGWVLSGRESLGPNPETPQMSGLGV